MTTGECNFWYWYYSTYIIAAVGSLSILVSAVSAIYLFCNRQCRNGSTDTTNETYKERCDIMMQRYEMSFFVCMMLLITSMVLSHFSYKECHDDILQQAFIGSMLVIIGSLSYHIAILALHFVWITSAYYRKKDAEFNPFCNVVSGMMSLCVLIHWILMFSIAYLLNCMVQIDDMILSVLPYKEGADFMHTGLKYSNDVIFVLSTTLIVCHRPGAKFLWCLA